ncbi:hypothetical protein [Streptomyces filamentosus]
MTLRVSRDSGRTWGPRVEVPSDPKMTPLRTSVWPPCECPRHREH